MADAGVRLRRSWCWWWAAWRWRSCPVRLSPDSGRRLDGDGHAGAERVRVQTGHQLAAPGPRRAARRCSAPLLVLGRRGGAAAAGPRLLRVSGRRDRGHPARDRRGAEPAGRPLLPRQGPGRDRRRGAPVRPASACSSEARRACRSRWPGSAASLAFYLVARRLLGDARRGWRPACSWPTNGYFLAFSRITQYQSLVLLLGTLGLWCAVRWSLGGSAIWPTLAGALRRDGGAGALRRPVLPAADRAGAALADRLARHRRLRRCSRRGFAGAQVGAVDPGAVLRAVPRQRRCSRWPPAGSATASGPGFPHNNVPSIVASATLYLGTVFPVLVAGADRARRRRAAGTPPGHAAAARLAARRWSGRPSRCCSTRSWRGSRAPTSTSPRAAWCCWPAAGFASLWAALPPRPRAQGRAGRAASPAGLGAGRRRTSCRSTSRPPPRSSARTASAACRWRGGHRAACPTKERFGFPYQAGWKAIGALFADGTLTGSYDSNEQPQVTYWYTRGAWRCSVDPRYYLIAENVQDEIETPRRTITNGVPPDRDGDGGRRAEAAGLRARPIGRRCPARRPGRPRSAPAQFDRAASAPTFDPGPWARGVVARGGMPSRSQLRRRRRAARVSGLRRGSPAGRRRARRPVLAAARLARASSTGSTCSSAASRGSATRAARPATRPATTRTWTRRAAVHPARQHPDRGRRRARLSTRCWSASAGSGPAAGRCCRPAARRPARRCWRSARIEVQRWQRPSALRRRRRPAGARSTTASPPSAGRRRWREGLVGRPRRDARVAAVPRVRRRALVRHPDLQVVRRPAPVRQRPVHPGAPRGHASRVHLPVHRGRDRRAALAAARRRAVSAVRAGQRRQPGAGVPDRTAPRRRPRQRDPVPGAVRRRVPPADGRQPDPPLGRADARVPGPAAPAWRALRVPPRASRPDRDRGGPGGRRPRADQLVRRAGDRAGVPAPDSPLRRPQRRHGRLPDGAL